MSFQHPWLLFLLLIVPLYLWLRARWHRSELKVLRMFVRPVLWDRVVINPPPDRMVSRVVSALALTLAIAALAGPVWGRSAAVISTGGKNVVIALDVSRSMASQDEVPSRIGRASNEIARLAESLEDVRTALILFSGTSRLASPMTLDREYLESRLPYDVWSNPDIRPGTRLADMVELMVSVLPDMDLEASLGIIFSDGGFHDYAVESAVETANSVGMRLITVGVGGPIEVPIPIETGGVLLDGRDTVRTSLDESSLKELAERTGGTYVHLSDSEDLAGLVKAYLESISGRNSELATGGATGTRRYQYFLAAALLLFAAAQLLERRGR